jgi:hypothetical protein
MTKAKLKWELIETGDEVFLIKRAKIPGGWLVWAAENEEPEEDEPCTLATAAGLTFVPDPTHRWDGNSLP